MLPVTGLVLVILAVVPVNGELVSVPRVDMITVGVVPVPRVVDPVLGVTVVDVPVAAAWLVVEPVPLVVDSDVPVPMVDISVDIFADQFQPKIAMITIHIAESLMASITCQLQCYRSRQDNYIMTFVAP